MCHYLRTYIHRVRECWKKLTFLSCEFGKVQRTLYPLLMIWFAKARKKSRVIHYFDLLFGWKWIYLRISSPWPKEDGTNRNHILPLFRLFAEEEAAEAALYWRWLFAWVETFTYPHSVKKILVNNKYWNIHSRSNLPLPIAMPIFDWFPAHWQKLVLSATVM